MKNKNIIYALLGIGAIAGFYFWKKNKMPKKLNCKNGTKKVEVACAVAPCPEMVVCA